MKINYSKTCTLPQDLVSLLIKRGLSIADEQRAISYLTNIGYFRFSAYLYPLLDTPKENHILRNLCGHHARLWNKEISLIATDPVKHIFPWIDATTTDPKRIYFRICIIKYLLFVSPNNRFTEKLKSLLAEYPTIDIRAMGFPNAWQQEPLWN